MNRRAACVLLGAVLASTALSAAAADEEPTPKPHTITCVGDSITQGAGIEQKNRTYPSQLASLLGPGWLVYNVGVSGTTMLKKGDKPYIKHRYYDHALHFKNDIIIIMLGTNDSKPQNWAHKDDFAADTKSLIDGFHKAVPDAKIYLCTPVPAFPGNFGIRNEVIHDEIIPILQQVAKEKNLPLIDCYTPLLGKGGLFPDKVHPNAEGAELIAEIVYKGITENTPAGTPTSK